ncbi:MAG: TetR/AcrR family transcriptional regulator, partial [Clostridia bacterium]|nr:TetR/AcrR family transcriptional regulator [Clostridia bacterium]
MNNRQIAAAETRKKLVEAAKNIICVKGLTNTSIDEITEACGVSKGTFYTYFKRKEDIVYELSDKMFDEILSNAQEFEGTITEKLENYMIHFSRYIEQGSLKLAQEWIKNVADPDISDVGAKKLKKDISAV